MSVEEIYQALLARDQTIERAKQIIAVKDAEIEALKKEVKKKGGKEPKGS